MKVASGKLLLPRFGTKRTPGRKTLGPRVTQVASQLGKPLLPHQRYIVDVALEINPDTGYPAYRSVIVVMPRQNGKTELLLPVMTHRAVGFDRPQRILYTAQTGGEARKKWEDIHIERLTASPFKDLFTPRLRINAEAMIWVNGSMWSPIATTKKTGGTGDTLDLGVIDEAWSRPDAGVELAMRPAMATRREAQMWIASMVPGLTRAKSVDSAFLREKMRLGRECVLNGVNDGIAYFEWSAPAPEEWEDGFTLDPGDPKVWRSCLPALGHTIDESVIAADFQDLDLVDFCAEYLGWWPQDNAPTWTLIRRMTWEALKDPISQPEGQVALGIAADDERKHAWMGVAGKRADGNWHLEVVEPGGDIPQGTPGVDWLRNRTIDFCNANDPLCVVVMGNSPAASEIIPLRQNGIEVITPNMQEYAAACGRFVDATGEHAPALSEEDEEIPVRLRHIGQVPLDRAVSGVRKLTSPTQGIFTWARVGSSVDIGPIESVTLGMHGHELKADEDYDLLESVW